MTKKKPRYEFARLRWPDHPLGRDRAHPQGSSRLQTHRSHLRADARADRGPVAGAGEQAAAESQFHRQPILALAVSQSQLAFKAKTVVIFVGPNFFWTRARFVLSERPTSSRPRPSCIRPTMRHADLVRHVSDRRCDPKLEPVVRAKCGGNCQTRCGRAFLGILADPKAARTRLQFVIDMLDEDFQAEARPADVWPRRRGGWRDWVEETAASFYQPCAVTERRATDVGVGGLPLLAFRQPMGTT